MLRLRLPREVLLVDEGHFESDVYCCEHEGRVFNTPRNGEQATVRAAVPRR